MSDNPALQLNNELNKLNKPNELIKLIALTEPKELILFIEHNEFIELNEFIEFNEFNQLNYYSYLSYSLEFANQKRPLIYSLSTDAPAEPSAEGYKKLPAFET